MGEAQSPPAEIPVSLLHPKPAENPSPVFRPAFSG